MRYVVSGVFVVAGVEPGGELEEGVLGDANVAALIEAGHLSPVRPSKSAPTNKADNGQTPKE